MVNNINHNVGLYGALYSIEQAVQSFTSTTVDYGTKLLATTMNVCLNNDFCKNNFYIATSCLTVGVTLLGTACCLKSTKGRLMAASTGVVFLALGAYNFAATFLPVINLVQGVHTRTWKCYLGSRTDVASWYACEQICDLNGCAQVEEINLYSYNQNRNCLIQYSGKKGFTNLAQMLNSETKPSYDECTN